MDSLLADCMTQLLAVPVAWLTVQWTHTSGDVQVALASADQSVRDC